MEEMMIITNDRKELNVALNSAVSLCILIGQQASSAGKVHTDLETGTWGNEPWQRWFLVTDRSVLSDEETEKWYGSDTSIDYVFLGRNTKAVVSRGIAKDDLLVGDECDYITCIEKFAEADLQ
jgi:hypothetical protein